MKADEEHTEAEESSRTGATTIEGKQRITAARLVDVELERGGVVPPDKLHSAEGGGMNRIAGRMWRPGPQDKQSGQGRGAREGGRRCWNRWTNGGDRERERGGGTPEVGGGRRSRSS